MLVCVVPETVETSASEGEESEDDIEDERFEERCILGGVGEETDSIVSRVVFTIHNTKRRR